MRIALSLVVTDQQAQIGFVLMDVEVVEPEPCHPFPELVWRVKGTQDAGGRGLSCDIGHAVLQGLLRRGALVWIGCLVGYARHGVEVNCKVEG